MTKRACIVYFLLLALLTVIYTVFLPETLRQMEGTSFFTSDPDFFKEKLAEAPGLTAWLSNFLLQFYRWPLAGMLADALILTSIAALCGLIPSSLECKGFPELSVLVPIAILLLAPWNIKFHLEVLFFYSGIVCGLQLKPLWTKLIFLLLWPIAGFFLTGFVLLLLSIVVVTGYGFYKQRSIALPIAGIASICIAIATVYASNEWLGFIPFEKRFLYIPEQISSIWLFILIFAGSVMLMMIPDNGKKRWTHLTSLSLSCACIIGGVVYGATNSEARSVEKYYFMTSLADKKDWSSLLSAIPREETLQNKMALRFALLAEAGLGTYADNVFNYPIATTEDLLYRHEVNRNSCIFNRLFYDNLGIYDEAMRMSFEFGVMTPEGICFNSLRQMIHYSILLGDYKVAEKYLKILSKSTFHSAWIENERKFLQQQQQKGIKKKPVLADTFVNVYAMNSEMVRQLQVMPENRKVLDYLLTGLLMQRDLQKFAIIMRGFPIYKNQTLPGTYAQACSMLANSPEFNMHRQFKYSTDIDKQFMDFYRQSRQDKNAASMAQYMGSYWYYYFYTEQENQDGQTDGNRQVN